MGELVAVLVAAAWAVSTLIFARVGVTVRPLVLAAVKCTLALALMSATLLATEGTGFAEALGAPAAALLVASGVLGLTVADAAHFLALVRLGPRRTLILAALTPIATALLAAARLGEGVGLGTAVGMAVTLAGVALVLRERAPGDVGSRASGERAGIAFALVAVLANAVANVLAKEGGAGVPALAVAVVRLGAGTVGLHLVLLATRRHVEVARALASWRTAAPLLAASFVGTYLGIWGFMFALGRAHTGTVSTLTATSPVFVLLFGRVVLGERITARAAVGTAAAVAGVALLFLW